MFQSTHPQGVRLFEELTKGRVTNVSIHAPAGGATNEAPKEGEVNLCFNPRTRRGCDPQVNRSNCQADSFNPRTRRGCDRKVLGR